MCAALQNLNAWMHAFSVVSRRHCHLESRSELSSQMETISRGGAARVCVGGGGKKYRTRWAIDRRDRSALLFFVNPESHSVLLCVGTICHMSNAENASSLADGSLDGTALSCQNTSSPELEMLEEDLFEIERSSSAFFVHGRVQCFGGVRETDIYFQFSAYSSIVEGRSLLHSR